MAALFNLYLHKIPLPQHSGRGIVLYSVILAGIL